MVTWCLAMSWLVISLENPKPSVRGWLRRYLLELPTMVFVGKLDAHTMTAVIAYVKSANCRAAIAVARRSGIGFAIEIVGYDDFSVNDLDGIGLPCRKQTLHTTKTVGNSTGGKID